MSGSAPRCKVPVRGWFGPEVKVKPRVKIVRLFGTTLTLQMAWAIFLAMTDDHSLSVNLSAQNSLRDVYIKS